MRKKKKMNEDYKNELFKAIDIAKLPKIKKLEMKINILNFYVDGKFIDISMYKQLLDKLKEEEQRELDSDQFYLPDAFPGSIRNK